MTLRTDLEASEMRLRLRKRLADDVADWHDVFADGVIDAILAELRDPGHDLTAAVVKPGDDRSEALRIWKAMIEAI